ncbi:hypothetical protein [Reichenbachiella versicolor]|uniref:hypothetical protein n=1 Tax=Reichenbachiella versicolor TaxID=1821036 RepID=UPI000D6DD904|nr:hypothetical protein [Reichenbachiella versicolor]
MTKAILIPTLLIFLSIFSVDIYAQEVRNDSLIIKHRKRDKQILVTKQSHDLRITTTDKKVFTGQFRYRTPDEVILLNGKKTVKVAIDDIAIVQRIPNPASGLISFIVKSAGYTNLTVGAGLATAGALSVDNNKAVGYTLIGLSLPFFYYGISYLVTGNGLEKKLRVKKQWEIVDPQ